MEPRVQYVGTPDGVSIAFTTYGEGGTPLVCLDPPHFSHLQREWEMPWNTHRRKLELLSSHRLVVRFDPRGSGLSDRYASDQSLQARVSDLEAVVDKLGLQTFAIYAVRNACLVALAYAHAHPERVSHLALEECFALGLEFWDTPVNRGLLAMAEYTWEDFTEANARIAWGWDHRRSTPMGHAGDVAMAMAMFTRSCITQADFLAWATAELAVDLQPILTGIQAPALIARNRSSLRRGHDEDSARRLATRLPNARFIVYGGDDITPEIDELLGDAPLVAHVPVVEAGLRTLLFTDLEGHTAMMQRLGDFHGREVLREHERMTREALAVYGGSEVKAMGDGFLASFNSTQRALECAIALQRAFSSSALDGPAE